MNRWQMWMRRLIAGLYAALMAASLLIVVLLFASTEFVTKKSFLLPQGVMLALGLLALIAAEIVSEWGRPRSASARGRRLKTMLLWLGLFGAQALLCYFAYGLPGWDAESVLTAAYDLVTGNGYIVDGYFSRYENNVLLALLYAAILKPFVWLAGKPGYDRCVFILTLAQCAINSTAALLTRRVARRMTGSERFAGLTFAVYVIFIGLSPWLMIPYSDATALIIPIWTVDLYQRREEACRVPAWPRIGMLAVLGYLLKPQTVIVTIAIALLETGRALHTGKWALWGKRVGGVALILFLGVGCLFEGLLRASPLPVDREQSYGVMHFLAVGLNPDSNGVYNEEDAWDSRVTKGREQRRQMLREKVSSRLSAFGPVGLAKHLGKKTLVNYADGTFAWGTEGGFFRAQIEDKDGRISPFLKDLFDFEDGERFPYYATCMQCIWLALLLGGLLGLGGGKRLSADGRDTLDVIRLSLIGLTLFELIFEARARYLFTYAPLYLLLGLEGIRSAVLAARRKAN